MKINHSALINSLRLAYSAEKAAAYAYVGHARSLKNPVEKAAVQQIENDESWMPIFEKAFKWGEINSLNDVDLKIENDPNYSEKKEYCKKKHKEQLWI